MFKMNKFIYYGSMTIIFLAISLLMYLSYWMVYPFKVAELRTLEVTTETVSKGGYIPVLLEFEKRYDFKPSVEWYLRNGSMYRISVGSSTVGIGETSKTSFKYIPDDPHIIPGTYDIVLEITYDVFPLRRPIHYTWVSNQFEVVDKE